MRTTTRDGWFRVGLLRLLLPLLVVMSTSALGDTPSRRVVDSPHGFAELVRRLEASIAANEMLLVAKASASAAAAARGVIIRGNAILEVFRNDYAVRMLAADVDAGIEAPLRLYVTENASGAASVAYRLPSQVFAPYAGRDLADMAQELDKVLARIVDDAVRR
jgi:uncharacterized protein (DUF302 family)